MLTQTQWTGDITGSVGRSYNNDFNVSSLSVNGSSISYGYDNDQLLTQAGSLTLARDTQNGLLQGTTLGNIGTSLSYTPFGELQNSTASLNGTAQLSIQYTHDKLGRITRKSETLQGSTHTEDYRYDVSGRLLEVKRNGVIIASYTYDDNDNRTGINGVTLAYYDDQDRLISYNGTTYSYTANGERLSKTQGNQTTQYSYDVLGNLRKVILPDTTVIDYLIDGQNRRIGKKVNGVLKQGWLYQDGLHPIADLDQNNQIVSRFIYADKGNIPSYLIKNGITYRIISDHLGSPRLILNTQDGIVAQQLDYDVWGNITQDTLPGFQPFGFAGGLYDNHTQLTRFGARDYDPEIGRWTAKDPIGFGGGDSNLYGYVLADPVNLLDPLGLESISCLGCHVGDVTNFMDKFFTDPYQSSDAISYKPPPGSKGINETPWSGDHQGIKAGIGAGPADKVKISPDGDVWAENPDGSWTNHGPASDYTGSGKPSGRKGKDRSKRTCK